MKTMFKLYLGAACVMLMAFTVAARLNDDAKVPVKGPVIKTDEDTYNFGPIKQGDVVTHVFTVRNTGSDTLKISNTQASCGCTTSMIDNKNIAPGGTGQLKAVFNSAGKMGHIVKTIYIYSNDVTNPNKTVQITADIQTQPPSVHNGTMNGTVHLEGVFEGDCASCHVDKGRGLKDAKLYEADCAICHGNVQDGKPGPDLHTQAMLHHTREDLVKIITSGVNNSMMPAFGKANHGPLSDDEIASVADYMMSVAKLTGSTVNTSANK